MRQCLHNNSDETCIKMLQSQLPALGPDSVLIIDEKVLPDEKPPADLANYDLSVGLSLAMNMIFGAQERRESHWRKLIHAGGFEIREIRRFSDMFDSVTIAVKRGEVNGFAKGG